jgi:hypothetical protein
MHVGI